jgi:hypothetical protein
MTVFVYVDTTNQVGDANHVKVFATIEAAEKWFEENEKALSVSIMSWIEAAD